MDNKAIADAYEELGALLQKIVELENPAEGEDPDRHIVSEWAVAVGVLSFGSDGFEGNEVQISAPDSAPLWRIKGLFGSATNKLNALESHNLMVALHADIDGDEEE